jgi:aminoglycoside phosphotransferase (APT) family kinase protein
VFQGHNLFPHLTALDNVLSGPVLAQGRPKAEARAEAQALLGGDRRVAGVEPLQAREGATVTRVHLADGGPALVLKTTGPAFDTGRTAAVTALARAAGVPVPAVVARGPSVLRAGWSSVLWEHADGQQWRAVRPGLRPAEVRVAHEALAHALLALQSVGFDGLGELAVAGAGLRVVGRGGLVDALRQRAALRVRDGRRRAAFERVLVREADLLEHAPDAVLCHDDLHSANVLFSPAARGWRLTAVLDWDKAWAGPAESDVARMALWDDMTGPGFWEVYRTAVPEREGWPRRAALHQLLWCLEYAAPTARHRADTAALWAALGNT